MSRLVLRERFEILRPVPGILFYDADKNLYQMDDDKVRTVSTARRACQRYNSEWRAYQAGWRDREAFEDRINATPTNPGAAAIEYALSLGRSDGYEFLRLWNVGEFDILRREWPDAPEEVHIGADPLYVPGGVE